ncbi:heme exporter protein CcmD [Oceanicaulis sp.]|uniref:heme exporter protein CcmD n=1 Tax=Oceanicaulis sp. TaxID=1924941 RepID=UPI003F70083A
MNALAEFFAMDGYAVYVWVSYGLSFLGSIALVWMTIARRRAAAARLRRLEALEASAAGAPAATVSDEDAA